MTEYGSDRVLRISSSGVVDAFATGISGPTGLVLLADGRLLVVSYRDEVVIDISAGGDFTGATPFASGFSSRATCFSSRTARSCWPTRL